MTTTSRTPLNATNIGPVAIAVLQEVKADWLSTAAVGSKLGMKRNTAAFHLRRAQVSGLVNVIVSATLNKPNLFRLNDAGLRFLEAATKANRDVFERPIHQGPQFYATVLNAPATPTDRPVRRSIKNLPTYVPPAEHCPRAGAFDFRAVRSKGL